MDFSNLSHSEFLLYDFEILHNHALPCHPSNKTISTKASLRIVSYEVFLDFSPNQGSWSSTKAFLYHFFEKKLKITP